MYTTNYAPRQQYILYFTYFRETSCQRCSPFDHFDSRLVLEDECTRTDYRIVRCVDGYYLLEGQCKICTDCSMLGKAQGQACKKDKDTVCCDVEGMVVKNEKCEFDPVHCGLGEYLVPGLNGRPGRCETCHPGSYQDENKHRYDLKMNWKSEYYSNECFCCSCFLKQFCCNFVKSATLVFRKKSF